MTTSGEESGKQFVEAVRAGISRQEVEDYYQNWAEKYDDDAGNILYNPPKIGATEIEALYHDRRDLRLLDVAAGTGLVGLHLQRLGFTNIDALDASEAMLKKAAEKKVYKNLYLDFLGPNRLNLFDNTYDALVGVGCFCEGHVREDCLAELIRVVKPGGHIVIAMREKFLNDSEVLREHLEATMQRHHDDGLWKWTVRKIVANYVGDDSGVVFIFQVL